MQHQKVRQDGGRPLATCELATTVLRFCIVPPFSAILVFFLFFVYTRSCELLHRLSVLQAGGCPRLSPALFSSFFLITVWQTSLACLISLSQISLVHLGNLLSLFPLGWQNCLHHGPSSGCSRLGPALPFFSFRFFDSL